jgi:hypothetical protein
LHASILGCLSSGSSISDQNAKSFGRREARGTGKPTRTVLPQANAYAVIRRCTAAAGNQTELGNHNFRAIGTIAYLVKNGGTLGKAAMR